MDSPLGSPVTSRTGRFSCRRIDKLCCLAASYFPLLFVYGTTTWAVYTEAYTICYRNLGGWKGTFAGGLALFLAAMALWCYTFAVFTSPGSPLDSKGYSHLPTHESQAVTVKSDGQDRFCKKCQTRKPDRAHHCSSCHACVLKMDHHCPWLANCLGLKNYKAFLLFLIYSSLLALVCFAVATTFVYTELFTDAAHYPIDDVTPVNWVLLAVVAGIIGLVLSGFTIWHLLLTASNMTTIESLEKVRYTLPSLRRGAFPSDLEGRHYQEHRRYTSYLLEESSKKLPHAFDLGRARNFASVFGGRERWWLWPLPFFSGYGDGWVWETSAAWRAAVDAQKAERETWLSEQRERERAAGWGYDPAEEGGWPPHPGVGARAGTLRVEPREAGRGERGRVPRLSKADKLLGRRPGCYSDVEEGIPLRPVRRRGVEDLLDELEDDDEEEVVGMGESVAEEELLGSPIKGPEAQAEAEPRNSDAEWASWGD